MTPEEKKIEERLIDILSIVSGNSEMKDGMLAGFLLAHIQRLLQDLQTSK